MATIATNNEAIAVIIIFSIKPEQQQELIDAIAKKAEVGFIFKI
jgi:hypothetical protein